MLRGIRKASANWLGKSVLTVVMGLLIVSFAVWGIGDIFRGFGRASLAQIGRTEITIEQFRQFYQDRLQRLGRRLGRPLTPDQARALGLDRQLLGELITEAVLNERARELRLGLSDDEIAKRITEDPNFQGALGKFDRQRFEQLIRAAGYTEPRFVAEQRWVLLRRQIAESVAGEVPVPQTAVDAVNRFQNEERSIEYFTLDKAKVADIAAPTPEVLQNYFEERKSLFRAPEYRKLVLLALSPMDPARWQTVTDADARRAFEEQRARYTIPERRQVQQIAFPSMTEATNAHERLKQGAVAFDGLAAERGLKPPDVDLGLLSKADILDPAIANAVFSLKEGEISEPVAARFGATLVRVVKIEPGQERSFEEVAPQIKRDIALQRGKAELPNLHDKVEDELASGSRLGEVAQKLGLTAHVIDAVDRSGRDPNGNPVSALPAGVDVLSAAFTSDVGVENEPVQLPGGGYLWYEVGAVMPSAERSFEEVKDRVETRWRDDQIAERLQAKSAELVGRLNSGASLTEIAAAENVKVEKASDLQRGKPAEALSASLIDEVFRTEKGATGAGPGQKATERVVFRVTDVKTPQLEPTSDAAKRIEDALRRTYSDDIIIQYVTQLQNELGVTINQSALRQVVGGEIN